MNASGFSDRDDPFKPGDLVEGRYRVIRRLSAGGVGAVYEAEHAFTGLHVALKALHNQSGDNPERMRAEARTLAEMRHPNIVQITDGGVTDRTVWFTMELLEGRTLRDEILRAGPLGISRSLRFALQIAEGVGAAHAAQVIHRDLKPENIFVVAGTDAIKILDFGTSKITSKQRRSAMLKTTDRFRLIGTQAYMPPERLRAGLADARADVYAIGHILYEMIAGRHCWSEGPGPLDLPPPQELGLRQIYTTPRPLREHAPDVPEWIELLVLTALAKDPEHRQQSMPELAAALRAALDRTTREHPVEPPRAHSSPSRSPEPTTSAAATTTTTTTTITREQPLWATQAAPVQAAEDRARIDALLVCGAARFAAGSTELDDIEKGLRTLADGEPHDPSRRGMVRALAHSAQQATEPVRVSVRKLLGWIGSTTGDEHEDAIQRLLRSMSKRGWNPDGDRIEPLPHPDLAIGAAMLVAPDRRLDSAENALVRLRDHALDVQSLAVSVMVAFARTKVAHHPAPRGALLALLLGGAEDSELAHTELAQFVLSAAAMSDPEPKRVALVPAARSPEPLPLAGGSPTPPAVSSTRRPPEVVARPAHPSPARSSAKLVWVIGLSAIASSTVVIGGFALRSRGASAPTPEAPRAAAVAPAPSVAPAEAPLPSAVAPAPAPTPAASASAPPTRTTSATSKPQKPGAATEKPALPASGL